MYISDKCTVGTTVDIEPRSEIVSASRRKSYYGDCQQYTSIPKDIPSDVDSVYIRGNPITGMYDGDFNGLSELWFLDLSYNEIAEIEIWSLFGSKKLEALILEHNNITAAQENMFNGIKLEWKLNLDHNRMHSLHPRAFQGADIKMIILRNNELEVIKTGTFTNLTSLTLLWLSDNKLHTLEPDIFPRGHGESRLSIILDSNKLSAIEQNIFSGLTLSSLSIRDNKIQSLHSRAFEGTDIPNLDLYGNNLHILETGIFTNLNSLNRLVLTQNKLHTIEADVFPSGLSELDLWLNNNDLTTLSSTVFSGSFPNKLFLYLRGNPLICDSSLCWLRRGEEEYWLAWTERIVDFTNGPPWCANYNQYWSRNIDLNCTAGTTFPFQFSTNIMNIDPPCD